MLLFVSLRLLVEPSTPIALQWGERAGELLRLVLLYVAACLKIALKTLSTSGGRPELRSIILLLLDNTNCFWEELRCEIFFFSFRYLFEAIFLLMGLFKSCYLV